MTRIAAEFAALPQPLTANHPFLQEWYACATHVPRHFLEGLRTSCIAMRPQDWAKCLAALTAADLRPLAQDICIPTLIATGKMDPIFPPVHSATLRQYLCPRWN